MDICCIHIYIYTNLNILQKYRITFKFLQRHAPSINTIFIYHNFHITACHHIFVADAEATFSYQSDFPHKRFNNAGSVVMSWWRFHAKWSKKHQMDTLETFEHFNTLYNIYILTYLINAVRVQKCVQMSEIVDGVMLKGCLNVFIWHVLECGTKRELEISFLAIIKVTSWWARWRVRTPASGLFSQPFVQLQIKENIKVPRHRLCEGNPPVTGGFPAQKASKLMTHHDKYDNALKRVIKK